MLTPVDIQQKKFHVGLGYDKKDVNTFFDTVLESYESLYRSNAELKEKVSILNDSLQNYRSKEASMEKSLKLAEKDTLEAISNATQEAKGIIRDAKNQAKNIVSEAEQHLEELQDQISILEGRYAAYKSNFCSLLKMQLEYLEAKDFDVDAMIDDRAWALLGAGNMRSSSDISGSDSFGEYNGDPQMRDESTLGSGYNYGGGYNYSSEYGTDNLTSTSAVYTQSLASGENFVDPFSQQEESRMSYTDEEQNNEPKTPLKVSNSVDDRKRMKRATVGSSEATAAAEKAKEVAAQEAMEKMYSSTTI